MGWGGQGGCEKELKFGKIHKRKFRGGGGGGGGGGGEGEWVGGGESGWM